MRSILRRLGFWVVAFGMLAGAAGAARADLVSVDVYSSYNDPNNGTGMTFSDLVESLGSPDIQFGTNTSFTWHPFGLSSFGADMTGCLLVAAGGDYTFGLYSDDGSYLFIDGNLVVNNGGPHGPTLVMGTVTLAAGVHPFQVQFFEDFGGPSGVDLILPEGVTYTACSEVPEPASMTLAAAGLILCVGYGRRRFGRG